MLTKWCVRAVGILVLVFVLSTSESLLKLIFQHSYGFSRFEAALLAKVPSCILFAWYLVETWPGRDALSSLLDELRPRRAARKVSE
jgi:hypothetical protein